MTCRVERQCRVGQEPLRVKSDARMLAVRFAVEDHLSDLVPTDGGWLEGIFWRATE
jgi:hypothetical protein